MYHMSNLKHDENILSISDWEGSYSIFLSSGISWTPCFTAKEIFLNNNSAGSLLFENINENEKHINNFIKNLEYYCDSIFLQDEVIEFNIKFKDNNYKFYTR